MYKVLFCLESSQFDQYTSGDLVSKEENDIHIVEVVFRKAVNKLRDFGRRAKQANKISERVKRNCNQMTLLS